MNLSGRTHRVSAIAPQDNTGALAGDIISMKKTEHITVAVSVNQGNAAPVAITLYQAKDVAGTDSKPLATAVPILLTVDAAASDIMVPQTDGVALTTDTALKVKLVQFEVPVENLDVNEGFTCLQVRVAASDAANLVSAEYWCSGERYHNTTKIAD